MRAMLMAVLLLASSDAAVAQMVSIDCRASSAGIIEAEEIKVTETGDLWYIDLPLRNISGRQLATLDADVWLHDDLGGDQGVKDLSRFPPWAANEVKTVTFVVGTYNREPKTALVCISAVTFGGP